MNNLSISYPWLQKIGVPIRKLLFACNFNNNNLTELVTTGYYYTSGRNQRPSISPEQDVSVASSLERYLYLVTGGNKKEVGAMFRGLEEEGRLQVPRSVSDGYVKDLLLKFVS